jgi:hypothetical protein
VSSYRNYADVATLEARVRDLVAARKMDREIARALNADGLLSAHDRPFSGGDLPEPIKARLLDDFVGAGEDRLGDCQTKCLGSLPRMVTLWPVPADTADETALVTAYLRARGRLFRDAAARRIDRAACRSCAAESTVRLRSNCSHSTS